MKFLFWRRPEIVVGLKNAMKKRSYSQKRRIIFQLKCMKAIGISSTRLEDAVEILEKLKHLPFPQVEWSKQKEIIFTWINHDNKLECFLNEKGKLSWLGTFNKNYRGCGEEYYRGELPTLFEETLTKVFF